MARRYLFTGKFMFLLRKAFRPLDCNLDLSRRASFFPLLFLTCFFVGCSAGSDLYLREELANRGPVGLSGTNPYLSPNLFVANEMKHSEVFRGFIHYRGTPDAVEVRTAYFKPLRVYLFYLGEGEAFLMEQGTKDWLVRGPDKIPSQLMASFFNMPAPGPNAPLAIDGETLPREAVASVRVVPPTSPAEEELAEVRSLRKVPARKESTAKPKPAPPPAPPTPKEDELASTVKESTSGDLIHRVTFAGESLRVISNWYTGDIDNTGRIARINGIENPDLLRVGETVRIPRYLLRTTKPLPQNEIKRFSSEFGS